MIEFERACETDDADLRQLLRSNSMASWVEISMEREPSYFAGMSPLTSDIAVIARDQGRAVGMYSGSVHELFIGGKKSQQGYLGGLRIHSSYRKYFKAIRAGYTSIARHIPTGDHDFWYTSIASENRPARRLLEAGIKGLPRYEKVGRMESLLISCSRGGKASRWRRASADDIGRLIAFHNREACAFDLAPVLSRQWIERIGISHFLLYGESEIEACMAIWDQSAFKQFVVRGYHPSIRLGRPLYNLYARATGRVQLPPLNRSIDQSFIAFACFSSTVRSGADKLMREALIFCKTPAAVIGLNAENPLAAVLQKLKPIRYSTHIYRVSGNGLAQRFSSMVQPEIALL